ncbi:prepilin-type N-terminal cleavage/methylation domain-containing protein [bacterium]|nr:prepilin-type N-terminal cleavage/methylation domain-containing protein [bacterium]
MKRIRLHTDRGFSLIEVIVAITIMAILAAAVVPVAYHQIEEARYKRVVGDLQAIYEAAMGKPQENYFGFVGDVGRLPDSIPQLINGAGQGTAWNGPYLSLGGSVTVKDPYGKPYAFDKSPIRVRSFGPNRTNNNGTGDDINYPENPISKYKGELDVQVFINGRLIQDATFEQVNATLSYANNGAPAVMTLPFNATDMIFKVDSIHQGVHVLTVNATKAIIDPASTAKELVTILPGSKTTISVSLQDADYLSRTDTDLNANGVPDRLEDQDGDGVPNSLDPDIDGDGTPNAIDPDSLNPAINGGAAGEMSTPIVNDITPSFGRQGETNKLITIDGAYFADGATVAFSGTGITVLTVPATFVGATQLTVRVTIAASAPTGYRNVTVTNPNSLYGSGYNKFEVLTSSGNPSPQITLVSPAMANQGTSGLLITITGQNLLSNTNVTFSNPGISITNKTFVSSSQINVTVNVSGSASTGAGTVRVTNPDNKFAESAFTLLAVKPNIASINPVSANTGNNNVWIQFTGSNFVSGFTATTSGSPLSVDQTQFQSATSIRVRVDVGFSLLGVDRLIYITNPGGGADTTSFHINGLF